MSRFNDKVVIITGSSSGIGRAAALRYAAEGASLTIHGQSGKKLESLKSELLNSGVSESRILVVQGAIEEELTQDSLIQGTFQKFGKIDVLVNNAGIWLKSGENPNSVESLKHILDVNVVSLYRLCEIAVPYLEKTKGNIVNISSSLSKVVQPIKIPYTISKAAVDHLTHSFAAILASKGIRVNSVNPGLVDTEFHSRSGIDEDVAKNRINQYASQSIPLQRPSTPEEQADLILYVSSSTTTYMTGANIFNDGGVGVQPHGIPLTNNS
uniref:Uncharacterized protein n=1 Tax=Panagrolaimus davidi TaxID=227884 RepID=A0A914QCX2_9BILA